MLTQAVYDELSASNKAVLLENKLAVGTRLSFCVQVLEKKLIKLGQEVFDGAAVGRRVIATGGAIWEASPAKDHAPGGCDPKGLPDIGSDEAYQDLYHDDAKCRIKPLGIGDLLLVEQKLCCYAPGEVAHIENILQGEYKERVTRRLRRTEDTFISITERETTDERDTITTEQHEMQNSTSSVLQEDMSLNVGMSAGIKGAYTYLNAYANFATSNSSNTSTNSATVYAKSVTDRALQRIVERKHEERIRKVIDEYEETNTHGLDNSKGTAHVVGVYRWADKIYEAKLVNHGKRLMFEFMIPEPAAFHLWAMSKPNAVDTVELVEPIDPRSSYVSQLGYGLSPLTEIGVYRTTYHLWGAAYGVALDPPPAENRIVSRAYSDEQLEPIPQSAPPVSFARSYNDLVVPPGYRAVSWNCYALMNSTGGHWVTVSIGTNTSHYFTSPGNTSYNFSGDVIGSIPVSIIGGSDFFTLNVHIWCDVLPATVIAWQKECYEKIMQAYFTKKAAYDQALAEAKSGYGNGIFGTNPAMNRQIERGELKKACLNALFNGADFSSDAIANWGSMDDCLPPMAKNDCCAVYEGERAKFLEQVFDWDYLAYLFYPYFHAQKCRWKMLYRLQDSDPDFLKFLQAGMARVIVPVRLGFEETAMHFLSSGQIWSGGPVPGLKSDLYLSIVQELMGAVEYHGDVDTPTWEIRVPTTLTVLQCKSGCTSGDGLPCDCGTGIGSGTSALMEGGGAGHKAADPDVTPTDPVTHG